MLSYTSQSNSGDYTSLPTDFSDAIVGRMSESSVESLQEAIKSIEEQIQTRQELHVKVIKKLDDAELEVNNFLEQFRFFQFSQEGREKLLLFRSKSIEMAQAKSQELLECWKDINKLKEEHRKLSRELSERKSRMSMLDSILR
jgi:hypothetical protein